MVASMVPKDSNCTKYVIGTYALDVPLTRIVPSRQTRYIAFSIKDNFFLFVYIVWQLLRLPAVI